MIRWTMGPVGELITIVLLSEDSTKSIPDGSLLHTEVCASLSPSQRSFLLRQMVISTDTKNTTGQGAENE